ncbi:acyltransferase family protein [Micromonospora cremea]|uniref:Peptidoglycan/LPS O-acetylase OafA/YrhL, contains acyltransferase and SGNH-hydrolase domains n=1 Tax=Micromonospora cremea TaxID=709881 RepID=A0A1N5Z0C9_9ACTN|nr:acyltransferase [Micromonospora cremea]SIN14927.1 Peptidoglycan/LPS O-acetylase OafA/YrhL, contains acyltransferase and SGNH-hydrolase domains [Micromonospora cremea]
MTAISYAEYRAMRRFPALDGLRAIAAVIVVAFHFGGPRWTWLSGWVGVQLFFVLSGFLITTLLLREEEGRGRVSLRSFYIRRFFRILPVYFVVLAATYALAHLNGGGAKVRESMPHYLLMVNEFAPNSAVFLHSWTIAIEWKFYLVWPLLAFVFVTAAVVRRIAVTLLAIAGLVAMIPFATAWPYWPIHYVSILVGCLLAVVMHHPRGYALIRPLTRPVVSFAVVVGFVAVHLSLPYWPPAADGHSEMMIGVYAVAVAILLPAMLAPGLPTKLLSWRPLVFVGERSYSLYLVQYIAMAMVVGLVPSYGVHGTRLFVATTVVGLLAADLLFRWVEQPMIAVGRRLSGRGRGVPPTPAGAPAPRSAASSEPADSAERTVPGVPVPAHGASAVPEPTPVPVIDGAARV